MRLITLMEKNISVFSCNKRITQPGSFSLMSFILIFFLGISGTTAQETVVDIFDLPAPARCVSEDLQVVGASLDFDLCGPACEEGEVIYYDLNLAIDNTTGSMRTSFAFYARLEQYNPDGTLAATYFVSGCKGPVPPNQITSLTFDESLEVLDQNGDPTGFPGIPYLCGGSLKLINLYEAWTDASDNDNRQCPLDASKIAPKCDVLPSIEIQTPLSAFEEVSHVSCYGGADGAIDITVSGGEEPYTFVWSRVGGGFSAGTEDVSSLTAGIYSVTITDANNCPFVISGIVVDQPAEIQITEESAVAVSCFGYTDGSISITISGGTPPYSVEWTGPDGFTAETVDLTDLAPGAYSVKVIDDNDCEATLDDIVVGEPDQVPTPDVQVAPADCFQTSGSFSIVNAPEDFEYSLDGGDWFSYTGTITGVDPGPHTLVARDGNLCESLPRDFVVPQPFDTPDAPSVSVVPPDCESLTGRIIITSGTTGFMFSINGADYVAYPEGGFQLAPGTYEVRVRSNDGCISEVTTVILEEPVCEDFQGCTLGYWKNHTDRWCDAYDTCTLYGDVFANAPSALANLTLLQVLNLEGGGINNLGRQSVAALLNACSSEVNYELATTAAVIAYVNANFGNAGDAGSYLDMLNNQGECPLGGSNATTAPSEGCPPPSGSSGSIDAAAGISVSPVPFKDHLNIKFEFNYASDATIQIFDMRGNIVKTHKESNAGFGKISTISTEFVRGEQMYIIKVTTNQGSYTKNVVSGKL